MVVKDADSRMTAASIKQMIWRMERAPNTGLLQAGIALIPGRTRFGRHQRIASRLMSRNFGRGFAAWSGKTANYWGHNAIMRIAAFRSAARLPELSGSAPLGGAILSHDFVEAAWMRRAGWDIVLASDIQGSAEQVSLCHWCLQLHRRTNLVGAGGGTKCGDDFGLWCGTCSAGCHGAAGAENLRTHRSFAARPHVDAADNHFTRLGVRADCIGFDCTVGPVSPCRGCYVYPDGPRLRLEIGAEGAVSDPCRLD